MSLLFNVKVLAVSAIENDNDFCKTESQILHKQFSSALFYLH